MKKIILILTVLFTIAFTYSCTSDSIEDSVTESVNLEKIAKADMQKIIPELKEITFIELDINISKCGCSWGGNINGVDYTITEFGGSYYLTVNSHTTEISLALIIVYDL